MVTETLTCLSIVNESVAREFAGLHKLVFEFQEKVEHVGERQCVTVRWWRLAGPQIGFRVLPFLESPFPIVDSAKVVQVAANLFARLATFVDAKRERR